MKTPQEIQKEIEESLERFLRGKTSQEISKIYENLKRYGKPSFLMTEDLIIYD